MQILEASGFVVRQENRGYFVAKPLPDAAENFLGSEADSGSEDYHRLADDWLITRLPEEVTEQFLRQRYGSTKARVNELLMRAARDGWAERKEGYGWRFLPVAKTPEAFDKIYRFRMAIEPAAMLEPSFALDRETLSEQRRLQEGMLEMDVSTVPAQSLLENVDASHKMRQHLSGALRRKSPIAWNWAAGSAAEPKEPSREAS